jgi:hypothetical protein
MSDQFPFAEGFEEQLLARLTRDREFFGEYSGFVKEAYFQSDVHQNIFILVKKYHTTYTEPITLEILNNEITKHFEYGKKPSDSDEAYRLKYNFYLDTAENLFAIDLSTGEQYTQDAVIDFAKRKELERVILNAANKITKGQPLDSIAQDMTKVLEIGKNGFILLSKLRIWDDVNEDVKDDDKWIVKGLIAKQAINVWYGPPGSGKSHLLVHIANCILDGRDPFPEIFWQPSHFIYFDFENSESIRGHIKKVCGGGKMPFYCLDLQDSVQVPLISDEEKFKAFILSLPPGVIIIDTLAMMVNSKGWVEGKWDVTPVMRILNQLKAKGYTFVLILHSLKGDPKTIKSPQELLAQSDHVVAIYPVKAVGIIEDKELSEEDDPNKPQVLFCGTRADLKSRYDKSRYWLQFDPNPESSEKGFKIVQSPGEGTLLNIKEVLVEYIEKSKSLCPGIQSGPEMASLYPNKEQFSQVINNKLGIGIVKAKSWIDKGVGSHWSMDKVKKGRQWHHYYFPIPGRKKDE